MNRANQQALFQATNQGLLGIRQAEINYYLNLNLAFGTQAALIGGFTYGVFTQNQINEDNIYGHPFMDAYWVMSAATIAAAVHVIINTMLLQVLGPGLALHGPVGSIVRATEGMKIEQKQIVTAFILMMMMFAVSTMLSFWVVMNFESAMGSTAIFVVAARYWYYYTERIYLRFYWDSDKSAWDEERTAENDEAGAFSGDGRNGGVDDGNVSSVNGGKGGTKEDQIDLRRRANRSAFPSDNGRKKSTDTADDVQSASTGGKSRINKFFQKFRHARMPKPDEGSRLPQSSGSKQPTPSAAASSGSSVVKAQSMEGYLTKSITGALQDGSRRDCWERRYFTLSRAGLVYYYKSRADYRADPRVRMLNKRPLNLFEYDVLVANTDQDVRLEGSDEGDDGLLRRTSYNFFASASVTDAASVTGSVKGSGGGAVRHRFEMTLVRKDEGESAESRRWLLRCDTEEELELWTAAMRAISPKSFAPDMH